jgi:hypothetical protein
MKKVGHVASLLAVLDQCKNKPHTHTVNSEYNYVVGVGKILILLQLYVEE